MSHFICTRMAAGKLRRHGCVSWNQVAANDRLFLVAVVSRDEEGQHNQSTLPARVGEIGQANFTNSDAVSNSGYRA